jgi:hypothetical protein
MEHFARGTNWATGEAGSPVDFLAMSNYVCYGDAPTHKMGYQLSATAASGVMLSQLRTQLGTGFEHATLELHEFGALINRHWRVSNELGAFGAALTVSNWQAALASGISHAFYWGFEDTGLPGTDLPDSSAWAMAMAEGAVSASPAAPAFALDVGLSTGAALPANTTVTAFAVREGAAEQDGLYIIIRGVARLGQGGSAERFRCSWSCHSRYCRHH